MAIQLTVVRLPKGISMAEMSKTFSEKGITLGRGAGNTWVLQDPDRYLSTSHCALHSGDDQCYIEDTSTNGTFLNGSEEPIGRGVRIPINDGDCFEMGDYKFSVSVWAVENDTSSAVIPDAGTFANASSDPFGGAAVDPFMGSLSNTSEVSDPLLDPFHPSEAVDPFLSDPFVTPADSGAFGSSFADQGGEQELDPLAALDKADGIMATPTPSDQDFFTGASQNEGANPMEASVSWPSTSTEGQIPDGWDDDLLSPSSNLEPAPLSSNSIPSAVVAPAILASEDPLVDSKSHSVFPDILEESGFHTSMPLTTPPRAKVGFTEKAAPKSVILEPEEARTPPRSEPAPMSEARSRGVPIVDDSSSESPTGADELSILIEAMGLDAKGLSAEEKRDIHRQVGLTMRSSVDGMMQALRARATIKNEFRMNVTTIQPIENNPLKFSADVNEALENLFLRHSKAYKNALEAIEESFDGIAEHQVAIIAGIREAFDAVLDRFNPEKLELQLAGRAKGVSLLGRQGSRNWSNYCEYYKELIDNMEHSFQYLFGEDFVQAYEEQLRRLAIARKTKNIDGKI